MRELLLIRLEHEKNQRFLSFSTSKRDQKFYGDSSLRTLAYARVSVDST